MLRKIALCLAFAPVLGLAQLRVATWNISNWDSSNSNNAARSAAVRTCIYGTYQGRSMAPDVLLVQEVISSASMFQLLSTLNSAAGSPGDWAAAPFLNGPDTDSVFFYRTSKVEYLSVSTISNGGSSPNPPRDTYRFDFRPVGYPSDKATIACYNVHLKAGGTNDDQVRRTTECNRIRTDAESLGDKEFLIAGDFNITSTNDTSYVALNESRVNNSGRFFDPINTPGSFRNPSFRFVHTQDPWDGAAAGGMDDRYDWIMTSAGLLDNEGISYIGNANIPYSTTTWNDPNHSYRCWGNDGSSYNNPLNVLTNSMVGPTIASALVASLGNQSGHLPVFMDLRVPPKAAVNVTTLNLGYIDQGSNATLPIQITNVGDTNLWGISGIANLNYSFQGFNGVIAPSGQFAEGAGGGSATHQIGIDTSTPGRKRGTLVILTNDPLNPEFDVIVSAVVVRSVTRR